MSGRIGELNPRGRPAQQLMELFWAEEDDTPAHAPIYTFTDRLLILGYVSRSLGELTVHLTPRGREVAKVLSQSMEGQLYKARCLVGKDTAPSSVAPETSNPTP